MKHCLPISKLSYISKLVELVVDSQFEIYMYIRSSMAINFLKLNDLKTELLLIGSRYDVLVPCSHIQIGNEQVPPSVSAQNLSVIFDSGMTLEAHVLTVF